MLVSGSGAGSTISTIRTLGVTTMLIRVLVASSKSSCRTKQNQNDNK
jgi:hypothetical protein